MISGFKKWVLLPLLGLIAGFLNALLGAGGGIPLVFGMRRFFGEKIADGHRFYATALAVMLPLSLFSVWQYKKGGALPAPSLWALLLPAALGGALGAFLLKRIPIRLMNKIFATVVLFSGILLVF